MPTCIYSHDIRNKEKSLKDIVQTAYDNDIIIKA